MRVVTVMSVAAVLALPAFASAWSQEVVEDFATEGSTDATATNTGQISDYTQQTKTNTGNIESTLTTVPPTTGDFSGDATSGNDNFLNPMPPFKQVQNALKSTDFDSGPNAALGGGDQTLQSTANNLYGQNPATNPGNDPVLDSQDGVLRVSSNIQGMAIDNLQQLETRLQQVTQLVTDLGKANSITAVAAINARLSIAAVAVEAQAAQAANLAAIATAQSEINRENEAQAMRNEHLQTASLFTNTVPGLIAQGGGSGAN